MAEALVSVVTYDEGLIWEIRINRPEKRNAVDGPTGAALANALIDFDQNPISRVAVIHGKGGTLCCFG